jgi:hypothetical protein
VAGLLPEFGSGVWVVPSETFQRAHYRRRGPWVEGILGTCTSPERAWESWMTRDAAFAKWVAKSAGNLGLKVLTVDGTRTLSEMATLVAAHLSLADLGVA